MSDPVTVVEHGVRALARQHSAKQLDEVVSALAVLASGARLGASELKKVRGHAEWLVDLVARERDPESWQSRTHWVSVAQLREQAGDLLGGARAWMRVAEVAPHRVMEAHERARAVFSSCGAFDEWLELTGSVAPRSASRLGAARTERDRQSRMEGHCR